MFQTTNQTPKPQHFDATKIEKSLPQRHRQVIRQRRGCRPAAVLLVWHLRGTH